MSQTTGASLDGTDSAGRAAAQLDNRIEIVTPENIAFKYRIAGPFRRALAYFVDVLIRAVLFIITAIVFHVASLAAGGVMIGLFFVIWFLVETFYGGLFETYWNGQTPGKRALGLRVVSIDGQPIDGMQAILRNFLRLADAWPAVMLTPGSMPIFLYQFGLLSPAFNPRFQRLGDLAAGTMVVAEERARLYGVARVTEPEAIQLTEYIPMNFVASRNMGRALSLYVERRGGFALARRAEIARHLGEPLRIKFNLPAQTNLDMLLCAVYLHTFYPENDSRRARAAAAAKYAAPVAQYAQPTARQSRTTAVDQMLDQMV